ncbi:hypothetical protein J7E87_17635 [Streptomyces sp. ISL-1]|uniref:aminoglycoside phosphotransferase family protein n=1 Tax=Streptomyces sp. ISL-1 TaxID=2817657 RepID=UPI001BEAA15C|nr:hypothetical protein [Streptomyces sp. ISL-1]
MPRCDDGRPPRSASSAPGSPEEPAATQFKYGGDAGREFIAALPQRAADFLERWELRQTGRPMHGWCALVLPAERPDGTPAALKLAAEQVSIGRILLAQRAGRQAG